MDKHFKHIFKALLSLVFFLNAGAQDSAEMIPPVEELIPDTIYQQSVSPPNESYRFKDAHPVQVDTRKVSDREVNELKSDDAYWYVNEVPPRKKREAAENRKHEKARDKQIFNLPWLRLLFWVLLIAGFIALLVWFLRSSNIRLFGQKDKAIKEEPEEEATGNIFEMNFENEIQKAIDAGNYRMAIRLMYLRTLRDLSNRGLINYTHEKTNSDYLLQLAGTPYYKNFFRLTRNFDYTWYGQFELSQDGFTTIQNDFSSFKQQLP